MKRPRRTAASWVRWGLWITMWVLLGFLLASLLTGCTRGPSVRQQPTATIETEGDVVVEQPTISEIARDLTAKVETMTGNVSQVGHKLDEQRRMLEEERMKKQEAADMAAGMLTAGIIVALALAPNILPKRLTLVGWAVALALIALAFIIPGLLF